MRKTIKRLLEDGVIIPHHTLRELDEVFKANPDLESDIIKIHKLAQKNHYGVKWEKFSLPRVNSLYYVYEFGVSNEKQANELLCDIAKLRLKHDDFMIVVEAVEDWCFLFYNPNKPESKEKPESKKRRKDARVN